jgi:ABC-2 type transport system permease protein
MSGVLTLAGRELRALLLSPAGYVIGCLFLLAAGLIFVAGGVFEQGKLASLRPLFLSGSWLLAVLCPAITMRSVSEEMRLGTIETLMTAPISEVQIVLGKFLGALVFLVVLLMPTAMYVVALELYGRPDYGELLCGYAGLVLGGMAYLSSGVLASALSSSQAVACLLAVFFWFSLNIATAALPLRVPQWLATIVLRVSPEQRLSDFAIGLFDSASVVYLLAFAAFFLTAAVVALQARRWP